MTLIRVVILLSLAFLLSPQPSSAEPVPDPFERLHIRITGPRLRQLFAVGLESSPTFRVLVERLELSDVVVYLQTDVQGSPGVAGRLTFLSVVAGTRYVVIRLTPLRSAVQQLAMIGHELQHAVEVAERPEIVDPESMFREYMRFGYLNGANGSGVAVDTKAAMEAGSRVSGELRDAPLVVQPPLLP
jgi:hypothetical protein